MSGTKQVLEFELGDRLFATEITEVREIVEKPEVTPLPNTPDCVEGVINLRGETATLLNPKHLLDVKDDVDGERILVTEGDEDVTGVLVDSVNEVYEIPEEELQDTDDFDEDELSEAVYRTERSDDFVVLLDLSLMHERITRMTQSRA